MKKIFLAMIIPILWLSACGDPFEGDRFSAEPKECRDNGFIRPCTYKESAMIDDMVFIINKIKTYRPDKDSFIIDANSSSPRVLLFGERHDQIMGQVETLATINAWARPGDFAFFEGADRRRPMQGNCPMALIYHIFLSWQAVKQGIKYYVGISGDLDDKEKYFELLPTTRHHYDFATLNLNVLRCGFWDDEEALKVIKEEWQKARPGENIFDNNEKVLLADIARNQGLREVIDYGLRQGNRVFINAGLLHLPLGEKLQLSVFSNQSYDYPSFYAQITEQKRLGTLYTTAGLTQAIYDHLTVNNIPYAQLIHRRMLPNYRP